MGAIGGLLGTAGGASGTGFSGPQNAWIDRGVTVDQAKPAFKQADRAVNAQERLMQALKGQNALGKQTSVFNQGQALANQLAGVNGVGNQQNALAAQLQLASQQQGLANQYANIAAGQGPNPALAALANATGANVANQAALMAGQRGSSANAGLMARQAAQAGAGIQQQAVGQAAEMQANQQLAAMAAMGAQQQAMGNTYQNVSGIAAQQLAAQQAQQQALAGQAAGMASNQIGATGTFNQAAQSQYNNILGGLNAQNSASVANQGNINSANAAFGQTGMQGQQGMIGGLFEAAGAGAKMAAGGMYQGGVVHAAEGGPISSMGRFLSGWSGESPAAPMAQNSYQNLQVGSNPGAEKLRGALAGLKPGGGSGAPSGQMISDLPMAAAPATMVAANGGLATKGGNVKADKPAQKAVKSGDSYANDKIPAMLSEGEVVLPRTVMQSANPAQAAAEFVANLSGKGGQKLAGGGIPSPEPTPTPVPLATPAAPVVEQAPSEPVTIAPQEVASEPAAIEPQAAQPVQPPQPQTEAANAAPAQTAQPAPAQQEVLPQKSIGQELRDEDAAFNMDLQSGAIKPETYSSLFAKQDTLGKIGTLFGLLVGGAGSGLTHRPNVILQMMNKEIEADLEAQKANQSNKQTWYQMNLQRLNQKTAQQRLDYDMTMGDERLKLDKAKAEREGKESDAQIANIKSQTRKNDLANQALAAAQTKMQMNSATLHKLISEKNKLPLDSPRRAELEREIAVFAPLVQNENYAISDQAEVLQAASNVMNAGHQVGGADDGVKAFKDRQAWLLANNKKDQAEYEEKRFVPGVSGFAAVALEPKDREKIQSDAAFRSKLDGMIAWIKANAPNGSIDPKLVAQGAARAADLQSAYRQRANFGSFNVGEKGFINDIIDSDPTRFLNQLIVLPKLSEMQKVAKEGNEELLRFYGFPQQPQKTPPPGSGGGSDEPKLADDSAKDKKQAGVSKSGQPTVMINGKLYYQKPKQTASKGK